MKLGKAGRRGERAGRESVLRGRWWVVQRRGKEWATSAAEASRAGKRGKAKMRTQVDRGTLCGARQASGFLWQLMGVEGGPASVGEARGKDCVVNASAKKM